MSVRAKFDIGTIQIVVVVMTKAFLITHVNTKQGLHPVAPLGAQLTVVAVQRPVPNKD